MHLVIRPAGPGDVEALHRIRRAAEEWLAARGVVQWGPGAVPMDAIRQQVDAGEWHVGETVVDGATQAVGGLRLLWPDPEVWQQDDGLAAYVHGLAIDRRFAGCGLGARLLGWAREQAVRGGVPALRLDCVESNARLRAYYAVLGFREVGRRDFDGPWPSATLLEDRLR